MRIKVTIEPQPREFIQRQAPEVRKQLRDAIHALENGEILRIPMKADTCSDPYRTTFPVSGSRRDDPFAQRRTKTCRNSVASRITPVC